MLAALRRLFVPTPDLRDVTAPTPVRVRGHVVAQGAVVSPVTGTRAALIEWALLEERSHHAGRGGGVITRYSELARGSWRGDTLEVTVDGAVIAVPLAYAKLELIEDPQDGQVLGAVPPELAAVVARLSRRGPIAYRESPLFDGDPIELAATVDADGATLRALPQHPITISER